jgi:outer membrane protein assembly factor BamB
MTWHSGKDHRFGLGPYLLAGQVILALADDGTLSMVDADPAEFKLREQIKLIDGKDAWGPLVLIDGLLIMRDSTRMLCVDLRQETEKDTDQ